MSKNSLRAILALTASSVALISAAGAQAQGSLSGTEGTSVESVIVTAERSKAAENAPSKASLVETQPESIISRKFIEAATPETGGWETVLAIAPSISGTPANGGGVGETSKITLRGFQDGQFNITYDGIAFGDTNGPTHHAASYWPASTIGSVVVDRGPGAAGDLGQANFGGALHFFSPDVSDTFGGVAKASYGSFNTEQSNLALNTGVLPQFGDGKLLLQFEQRKSDGELSHSGGSSENVLGKFIMPVGPKATLTLFSSINQTRFYQSDAGPGATYAQILAYGKNFALTNVPNTEHFYGDNYQYKATDFEYADIKGEIYPSITAENQLYTYYYTNKTTSTDAVTDLTGNGIAPGTSLINKVTAGLGESTSDLGGYDKLNQYRVYGDIVRLNKDWSFGTLKVGGQIEKSTTDRHNLLIDLTDGGAPDNKYQGSKYPNLTTPTNAKTQENSDYLTWQVFADFDWRPIENLKISPGFKYIHSKIDVNAANESVASSTTFGSTSGTTGNVPLVASNTYSSPLYFLTVNYKIRPDWSVYGQVATSFLLPGLPNLYYAGASVQSLQPERTISYQAGTVYSHGAITADADVYRIDATDLQQNCVVDGQVSSCNVGDARYVGVEGEAAYAFDFGLTVFGNGALISAKQLANATNLGAGILGNPAETLANAPKFTASAGVIYRHGPWEGALTFKQSGAYSIYNTNVNLSTDPNQVINPRYNFSGYNTLNASAGYDFGHFKIKLQGFNLGDNRAITNFTPSKTSTAATAFSAADTSLIEFQSGRELAVTLEAKF